MGRASECQLTSTCLVRFVLDLSHRKNLQTLSELSGRLWTGQKSRLIAEYLHRFLHVTKSGTYLDLFAGPQSETYNEGWSIKRVIERRDEGPNLGYFAACDNNPQQIKRLEQLRDTCADRPFTFKIYHGDANEQVKKDPPRSSNEPAELLSVGPEDI